MKKAEYHFELRPIVEKLEYQLFYRDTQPENVQLQIKYGFLKSNKNQTVYKSLVNSSKIRPIDLNQGHNKFNFKVNARCSLDQHNKARSFLKQLSEKSHFQQQQKYHLWLNQDQEKYLYDCDARYWSTICKEQLIKFQYNFLYKNRLFRINLSKKTKEQKKSVEKIEEILSHKRKTQSCLRFKHINIYKVHQYYEIWSSIVFETSEDVWFNKIKDLIEQKGNDIGPRIKEIINYKEKKQLEIKHELQLKFTSEGIELIKNGDNSQPKYQFSKAFDFCTELTQKQNRSEQELIKMMEQLGLEQNKNESQEKETEKVEPKNVEEKEKQQQIEYIVRR